MRWNDASQRSGVHVGHAHQCRVGQHLDLQEDDHLGRTGRARSDPHVRGQSCDHASCRQSSGRTQQTSRGPYAIADTLREVIKGLRDGGQRAETSFEATLILGGQIAGNPPRLFLIYPQGNFIEAGEDTPFFQIGEIKYGRPILVRAYDPDITFAEALKLLLVSFDSTLKANLSVGAPLDYFCYKTDSLEKKHVGRVEADNPEFQAISTQWGNALKQALDTLPDVHLNTN